MNPHLNLGIALVWSVLCGPLLAQPVLPHVTAKVTVEDSNDYKDIAGSNERSKVQRRQLSVALDNRDADGVKDVQVKWTIYAHKLDGNLLVTVKQGTIKAKLEPLKILTVESDKVVIRGTPKHTVTTRGTVRGKIVLNTKHHEATGEDYYGYAVEVFVGSVLVAEIYSQPSLKHG